MRDVMRGAWCVIRMIFVGVALSACLDSVALPTTQPGSTPSVAVSQSPTPLSVQPKLQPMDTDCAGGNEPPVVATGWKLLWQKVFDNPIARPPVVNNSQMVILERTDPSGDAMKDTVWAMNPQTSAIQWRFDGVSDAATTLRHIAPISDSLPAFLAGMNEVTTTMLPYVTSIEWSPKYVVLSVRYRTPSATSEYAEVLDRLTGQLVHSERLYIDEATVSDDALFYRGIYRELRRTDLPAGISRWVTYWPSGNGLSGVFVVDSQVYAFNNDQRVYHYEPISGSVVATATIKGSPNQGDVLIQNGTAIFRSWYGFEGVTSFDFSTFTTNWMTRISTPSNGYAANAFWGDGPSMSLTPDSIYLFDAQDNLWRLDLATGQMLWHVPWPGVTAMSRPVAMQGLVYGFFGDGTVRAYSEADGQQVEIVMKAPLWYWTKAKEWRDLVGGLGVSGDTLIVTTGCRSVYAIQRAP